MIGSILFSCGNLQFRTPTFFSSRNVAKVVDEYVFFAIYCFDAIVF